jgi:high-affinity nickel-transport protein
VLTAVTLGFLLGLRHAFDPDHVIAVSTLVTRHRSPWSATWVGVSWGAGHALTILLVGGVLIGLHIAVPERFGLAAELGVGVLLVSLGVANLRAAGRSRAGTGPDAPERPLRRTLVRSGAVGLAHGLAGSSALALLATAAMPTPAAAFAYLLVFGIANLAVMAAFSLVLGAPLAAAGQAPLWRARLAAGTGLASLLCGIWLIHRVGLVEGLLA